LLGENIGASAMSVMRIDPTDIKLIGALLAILLVVIVVATSGCATVTAMLDDWAGYVPTEGAN
jgi:hypothetical protein